MSKWGNGYDEIGFNSPDWDNMVDLTSEPSPATYTCTESGWIAFKLLAFANTTIHFKINGNDILTTYGQPSAGTIISGFPKVSKGDVVYWEKGDYAQASEIRFVPHK